MAFNNYIVDINMCDLAVKKLYKKRLATKIYKEMRKDLMINHSFVIRETLRANKLPETIIDSVFKYISLREQEARIDEHQKLNLALDYTMDIREWSMHRLTELKKEIKEG